MEIPKIIDTIAIEPNRIITRWSNGEIRQNDYSAQVNEWRQSANPLHRLLADWENFRQVVNNNGVLSWPSVRVKVDLSESLNNEPFEFDPVTTYKESKLITTTLEEKIINKSGNELKQNIFGDPTNANQTPYYQHSEFYHQGSSNRQAQRTQAIAANSPNVKPIPFKIPSESYTDPYFVQHRFRPEGVSLEDWQRMLKSPTYLIKDSTYLGGSINYTSYTINWIDFNPEIYISQCIFLESVNIQYINLKYSIDFYNCEFTNGIAFRNLKTLRISFANCSFKNKTVEVQNCNLELLQFINCKELSIIVSIDKEDPENQSQKISNDIDHKLDLLKLTSSEIEKFTLVGKNIKTVNFENSTCEEAKFHLSSADFKVINEYASADNNAQSKQIYVKDFTLNADNKNTEYISIIQNIHIGNFSLTGSIKNATLVMTGVVFDKLTIQDFINEGKVRLNDVSIFFGGSVNILRSQLSKMEFNSVNFSEAQDFKIYLSNITEIITHNTIFPNNIIGKDKKDHQGTREIYRQLKNASSKQSDRINELKYEETEMKAFKAILSSTSNNNDIWILRLNEWSNRHGQDWVRAGTRLILVSFILFCATKICLGYWYINISLLFGDLTDFVNFTLNPLHKFSDIFKPSTNIFFTGLSQFIDILARLFSGFMIFQFLRAFRKYVR